RWQVGSSRDTGSGAGAESGCGESAYGAGLRADVHGQSSAHGAAVETKTGRRAATPAAGFVIVLRSAYNFSRTLMSTRRLSGVSTNTTRFSTRRMIIFIFGPFPFPRPMLPRR